MQKNWLRAKLKNCLPVGSDVARQQNSRGSWVHDHRATMHKMIDYLVESSLVSFDLASEVIRQV